jgi:hypothetical protein
MKKALDMRVSLNLAPLMKALGWAEPRAFPSQAETLAQMPLAFGVRYRKMGHRPLPGGST